MEKAHKIVYCLLSKSWCFRLRTAVWSPVFDFLKAGNECRKQVTPKTILYTIIKWNLYFQLVQFLLWHLQLPFDIYCYENCCTFWKTVAALYWTNDKRLSSSTELLTNSWICCGSSWMSQSKKQDFVHTYHINYLI